MGLDMYAMTTKEPLPGAVDFKVIEASELHYWRKHPNLHGWMADLYYDKGGTAMPFNCVTLALTSGDLDRLEADVRAGKLPQTAGFFFGGVSRASGYGPATFPRGCRWLPGRDGGK